MSPTRAAVPFSARRHTRRERAGDSVDAQADAAIGTAGLLVVVCGEDVVENLLTLI